MFHIVLTVLCAVFMLGYIFFAVAGEQDSSQGKSPSTKTDLFTGGDQDSAA